MRAAYDTYYASSVYDERYPCPNRRTLSYVLARLPAAPCDIVDIGAGNGRYALPLLAATNHRVWAVERSPEARAQLMTRGRHLMRAGRLEVAAKLDEVCLKDLNVGAALFLFGVLAHMCHDERKGTLGQLRDATSRRFPIIGSVPNLHRRFRTEQLTATADGPFALPRITYHRTLGSGSTAFNYTLFTPDSLRTELVSLGWLPENVAAESLFPESRVTRLATLGTLDRLLSPVAPTITGYGLLFTAQGLLDDSHESVAYNHRERKRYENACH